jgi:hypothetical protein
MREFLSAFFYPVSRDHGFRTIATAWIADQVQFRWDTSVLRVIDNLVIGARKSSSGD